MASHRYLALDGMRGVAALGVMAYHLRAPLGPWLMPRGYLAVDLFFVLSGFVIAASYEERLAQGAMTTLDFLRVRFIRLYPLFFLGLMLGLAIPVLSLLATRGINAFEAPFWQSLPFAIFMLPSPVALHANPPLFPLDSAYWSLFFEMVVNVAYVLTRRFWTVPAVIAAMLVSGALMFWQAGGDPLAWSEGWRWSSIGFGFLRVFYSFPAGVLVYRLFRRLGAPVGREPSWIAPLAVAALLMVTLQWAPAASVLIVFPLLVLFGARAAPGGLLAQPFAQLGLASYALYAIHVPIRDFVAFMAARLHFSLPLGFAALAVLLLPAALLVDRYYDAPIRRALTAAFRRPRRAAPAAGVEGAPS